MEEFLNLIGGWIVVVSIIAAVVGLGMLSMIVKCFRKVPQGYALVRTGMGETKVTFSGILVFPVIHRPEIMDISVKRIEIDRSGKDGLICRDNMRADVKVVFFVRVSPFVDDVKKVAQMLGCRRASDQDALIELFDAKFSEALKTVGKQFDFVDLYTNRDQFKEEIIKVIGTDLNGYVLDDAAIDYLEQTSLDSLNPDNILDAEGIKKITELTAKQAVLSNAIIRDKQKTIKKQDVEAREAILELERQLADAEQKQLREIAEITAREEAQAKTVQQQERLKFERARISTDEEVGIADQNKQRQIIVAQKNKERTEAVENERVARDRLLEATEKERLVELAQIEKEKAVEAQKKLIQDVIRERVTVERSVVEEEEKIKDTREFATANRARQVAVTRANEEGEAEKVKFVIAAEATKDAAALEAEEVTFAAEGRRAAAEKDADAKKMLADAKAAEEAAVGLAEAQVMEAKAAALRKHGQAEADVLQQKFHAEAEGITEKAAAMKLFDGVGREHEEFKLNLNKDREIELAEINKQKDIAARQAEILGTALKSARIDIVGGEATFFDKIVNSITGGKQIDRMVDNSRTLTNIRDTFFSGNPQAFKTQLQRFVDQFGISSADLKNLSVTALLARVTSLTNDKGTLEVLERLTGAADDLGLSRKKVSSVFGDSK